MPNIRALPLDLTTANELLSNYAKGLSINTLTRKLRMTGWHWHESHVREFLKSNGIYVRNKSEGRLAAYEHELAACK